MTTALHEKRAELWVIRWPALLVAVTVFLGAIEFSFIALSLTGLSIGTVSAWLATLAALALSALTYRAGAARIAAVAKPTPPPSSAFLRRAAWVAALSALGLFCFLGLFAYFAPDLSFDGNWYHLPAVDFWLKAGSIAWIEDSFPSSELLNGYPKGLEVFSYWLVLLFGEDAANLANFLFWPLAFLTVGAIALEFGASFAAALLVASLYLWVPSQLGQGATLYVDASFAASLMALFALLMLISVRLRYYGFSVSWPFYLAAGIAWGLALGIKGSGALLSAPVLALWFANVARSGFGSWRRKIGRALGLALFLGALAFMIGGFWYARNLMLGGSPLYPVGVKIGELTLFPGITSAEAMTETANTPKDYQDLPGVARIFLSWADNFGQGSIRETWTHEGRRGGLGLLWLLACFPAILWRLWRALRGQEGPLSLRDPWLFLMLAVATSFFLMPMNWWARYTLWIYALGLPCLALLLTRVRPSRPLLAFLLLVGASVAVEGGLACQATRVFRNLERVQSLSDLAPGKLWNMHWSMWEETPLSDRLREDTHTVAFSAPLSIGPLLHPLGARRVLPVPKNLAGKELDLWLMHEGVRWLIISKETPLTPHTQEQSIGEFRQSKTWSFRVIDRLAHPNSL